MSYCRIFSFCSSGKELHEATEHHDLILHKDKQKKSGGKDNEEEKKSAPHHYHNASHHDDKEKHDAHRPQKTATSETAGWHANI